MSCTVSPQFIMGVREVIEAGVDAASSPTIVHNGFDLLNKTLKASGGDAPASKISFQTYALVAGAKTIDLTALLGVNDLSQDCTGLKVQQLIFVNPAGNDTLTFSPGASNPYPLFGTGNDFDLPAGATVAMYVPESLADVSGTVKTIDVAGTGTQSFSVGLVLG